MSVRPFVTPFLYDVKVSFIAAASGPIVAVHLDHRFHLSDITFYNKKVIPKHLEQKIKDNLLVHSCCVREFDPIKLASDGKKSRVYFRHLRWSGKRRCPRCGYRNLYYLFDYRFGCKRCRYKFGEFTGTYIGEFNFSLELLVHLTYLFALGVPAYRIRFYVPLSLTTIEKTFRVFRQSIYNESLLKLKELKKLSGELEIDEALFGGHRKGKRGWGSEGKSLVFGIYLSKKWQGHYISCIRQKT